jgi:hypothetical protein
LQAKLGTVLDKHMSDKAEPFQLLCSTIKMAGVKEKNIKIFVKGILPQLEATAEAVAADAASLGSGVKRGADGSGGPAAKKSRPSGGGSKAAKAAANAGGGGEAGGAGEAPKPKVSLLVVRVFP